MKIFGRFEKTAGYLCVGEMKKSWALVGYFGWGFGLKARHYPGDTTE